MRIEAGLLLIGVDFSGSKKAMITSQAYSRSRWVWTGSSISTRRFIGGSARSEKERGPARQVASARHRWTESSAFTRSRAAAHGRRHSISRRRAATTRSPGRQSPDTWSPVLKRPIAQRQSIVHICQRTVTSRWKLLLSGSPPGQRESRATPFFNPRRRWSRRTHRAPHHRVRPVLTTRSDPLARIFASRSPSRWGRSRGAGLPRVVVDWLMAVFAGSVAASVNLPATHVRVSGPTKNAECRTASPQILSIPQQLLTSSGGRS
jgi:hypothetical protein